MHVIGMNIDKIQ